MKNQFFTKLIYTVCSFFIVTTVYSAPRWIEQIYQDYPNSFYLSGLGASANVEQARDRAMSNLAQSIRVTIKSQTNSQERVSQIIEENSDKNDKSPTITAYDARIIQDDTQLSAEFELPSVEVAKSQFDEKDQVFYVLVVLSKKILADFWQNKIKEILPKTIEQIKIIEGEPSSFNKLDKLKVARQEIQKTKQYQEDFLTLGVRISEYKNYSDEIQKTEKKIIGLLDGLQIEISLIGDTKKNQLLYEALSFEVNNRKGFMIDERSNQKLIYRYELTIPFYSEDYWWQTGEYTLIFRHDNKVIKQVKEKIKIASGKKTLLNQKLNEFFKKKIANSLDSLLGREISP